jgi:hypothetical protein
VSGESFAKRQREKAKLERSEQKRARRESRRESSPEPAPQAVREEDELLAALESLHRAYEQNELSLEDFELRRSQLLDQLRT